MFLYLLCLAESWAKKGKPSWNWSFNKIFSFSCSQQPFPGVHLVKRSDTVAAVEWWNGGVLGRVGSGRVGSGRVGWTPFFTRLDPSLTLFRCALIIAPFTMHFALLAERLKQAVLSLDELSKKKAWCRTQETTTYIFFESEVEPLITNEESRDKINAITCRIHNFNFYYGNVLQSNNY